MSIMREVQKDIPHRDAVFPRGVFIERKICEYYQGGRIIDVGCGNGKITQSLGELGVNILGIDIDKNEIKKAMESNIYENVQFSCVNLDEIIGTEFEGVLLSEVLEHTEEPLSFLRQISRLCKNEGFLILTVPNGYSLKEILMAVIRFLKKNSILARIIKWYKKAMGREEVFNESPHLQQFSLRRIRSLIEKSGFTIEEEFYSDIWSGFIWMYFPRLPMPYGIRKIERKITNYLPYYLLGDFGFLCIKKAQD